MIAAKNATAIAAWAKRNATAGLGSFLGTVGVSHHCSSINQSITERAAEAIHLLDSRGRAFQGPDLGRAV